MPVDRATFELVRNLDHPGEMVEVLPAVLYGKPRLEAFVRALGHGIQLLEEQIADRALALSLDTANGSDLDTLGRLVTEKRDGARDDDYRRFISARLLVTRSTGVPNDLIRIARLAAGASAVAYFDMFPAGFRLHVGRPAPMSDRVVGRVTRMLVQAKPAGVTMLAREYTGIPFGFQGNSHVTVGGFGVGAFSRQLNP